ncbi:MAG TPA: hypothetical protein VFF03_08150 [Rhodocyclaceae bacterium]|nr:hypothetical protein [Rhodocyclaceae bacterium]
MIRKLLAAAILAVAGLSVNQQALATAQAPEVLVMDGKEETLFSEPLEQFIEHPENTMTFLSIVPRGRCSYLRRGYRATWEIVNNRLSLRKLKKGCGGQEEVSLSSLFPGRDSPVSAEWYSGRLIVPQGNMIEYVHLGYFSKYESYLLLHVEKGLVIRREVTTVHPWKDP